MGLPMNNLHAPTVASGPTSNAYSNGSFANSSLTSLMQQKDNIEAELSALGSVLQSHGVTMSTSLTTFDGYPRSDIDVAQIRTTRARIIRLKNDHKDIMERIEKGLHEHYANGGSIPQTVASSSQSGVRSSSSTQNQSLASQGVNGSPAGQQQQQQQMEPPFAKINSIVPSSPAATAGLRPGDKITKFGYVNWMNHEKLSRVAQVVQANEGQEIVVKVLRSGGDSQTGGGANSETVEVVLVPRHNWGGRGMLGCHLVPL